MRRLLSERRIKIGGQMSIGEFGRLFSVGIVCFALGIFSHIAFDLLIK